MTKDFTGAGDPRRSIALLWGRHEPGRRGPKARLSPEEVIQAAIALADAEGLSALSMRRVAQAVGVSPMSLYTYVPSKAELLDLMFDRAIRETADPDERHPDWRAKLAFVARERWALTERHPWLLDLAMHRPPLGPNVLRNAETVMNALDGLGLSPDEIENLAESLQYYMIGALQSARAAREVEQLSGMTDEQWITMAEPALIQHLDATSFPVLSRLISARRGAQRPLGDPAAQFAFGLERVLDGLDAFIKSRAPC